MESNGDMDSYNDYIDEDVYFNDEDEYVDDEQDFKSYWSSHNSERSYHVLNESEIRQRQLDEISHVSDLLSIPFVSATRLLHHYKWNLSRLHDEWFEDESKVRVTVGLTISDVTKTTREEEKEIVCGICFDLFSIQDFYSLSCRHFYCKKCWKRYITTSIMDGPGCLSLRCPEPSCRVAVCRDTVEDLTSEEERRKYSCFLLRSYVEENKKIKWCPAPGCDNAVELELGDKVYDVTCLCSCVFCWNCGEDAHRPVDCETVGKWIRRNRAESENTMWILANTKLCPKCKRTIEKSYGCMHMTCSSPCNYEFCWLCLRDYNEHDRTSAFSTCNIYEKAKQEGLYDEEEKIREMEKNCVEKYTHYYERWAAHQKSREKAIESLNKLQNQTLRKLILMMKETMIQLEFIPKAWEQIIECRRVLKWTYVYGYYFPENKNKDLFEYSQGLAEAGLERLHKCAEEELGAFIAVGDAGKSGFKMIRQKLLDLTVVTHSHFSTLVEALESKKL